MRKENEPNAASNHLHFPFVIYHIVFAAAVLWFLLVVFFIGVFDGTPKLSPRKCLTGGSTSRTIGFSTKRTRTGRFYAEI